MQKHVKYISCTRWEKLRVMLVLVGGGLSSEQRKTCGLTSLLTLSCRKQRTMHMSAWDVSLYWVWVRWGGVDGGCWLKKSTTITVHCSLAFGERTAKHSCGINAFFVPRNKKCYRILKRKIINNANIDRESVGHYYSVLFFFIHATICKFVFFQEDAKSCCLLRCH